MLPRNNECVYYRTSKHRISGITHRDTSKGCTGRISFTGRAITGTLFMASPSHGVTCIYVIVGANLEFERPTGC